MCGAVNETVEHFSKILTDITCPYFEVSQNKKTMRFGNSSRCAHSRETVIDKPWFTPELKIMFTTYRVALSTFNRDKNFKKSSTCSCCKIKHYKCMESRLKRCYLGREGDMLEHMRKSSSKAQIVTNKQLCFKSCLLFFTEWMWKTQFSGL